jgi:hypothetical protein
MLRSLFIAALAYGFGHPSFDGYRPTLLDRPLQGFYQDVNKSAQDASAAFATLNEARCMRYLLAYIHNA